MSKVTDERLDYILDEIGIKHTYHYDDFLNQNRDYFDLKDDGLLIDQLNVLDTKINRTEDKVNSLLTKLNRLMDYLEVEEITTPPETKIVKLAAALSPQPRTRPKKGSDAQPDPQRGGDSE